MAEWGEPETDKNLSNFRLACTFPSCHKGDWTELARAILLGGDLTLERLLGVQEPKGSIFPTMLGPCYAARAVSPADLLLSLSTLSYWHIFAGHLGVRTFGLCWSRPTAEMHVLHLH